MGLEAMIPRLQYVTNTPKTQPTCSLNRSAPKGREEDEGEKEGESIQRNKCKLLSVSNVGKRLGLTFPVLAL